MTRDQYRIVTIKPRARIKWLTGGVVAALAIGVATQCLAQETLLPAPDNHVYVTQDSSSWMPSDEQQRTLVQTVADYFSALDGARYHAAYAFLSDSEKQKRSLETFSEDSQRFHNAAGPLVARRVVRITWSRNPASGPTPGIYGAIDLVSAFDKIDRRCGYIVFYQATDGGPFKYSSELEVQLDNETARMLTQNNSYAYLNSTWAQLAGANCPNYPGFNSGLLPVAEKRAEPEEFKSVGEAYASLSKRPGIESTNRPDGWTLLSDKATLTVWGFAPRAHYAYPAMWRKHVVQNETGGVSIALSLSCQADKAACDRLMRDLQSENEQQADHMRAPQQGSAAPP